MSGALGAFNCAGARTWILKIRDVCCPLFSALLALLPFWQLFGLIPVPFVRLQLLRTLLQPPSLPLDLPPSLPHRGQFFAQILARPQAPPASLLPSQLRHGPSFAQILERPPSPPASLPLSQPHRGLSFTPILARPRALPLDLLPSQLGHGLSFAPIP